MSREEYICVDDKLQTCDQLQERVHRMVEEFDTAAMHKPPRPLTQVPPADIRSGVG